MRALLICWAWEPWLCALHYLLGTGEHCPSVGTHSTDVPLGARQCLQLLEGFGSPLSWLHRKGFKPALLKQERVEECAQETPDTGSHQWQCFHVGCSRLLCLILCLNLSWFSHTSYFLVFFTGVRIFPTNILSLPVYLQTSDPPALQAPACPRVHP